MAKKKRDYKAEYARRIARGKKRGLTKSQARGHSKPGEKPLRGKPVKSDKKLETALRFMRNTGKQGLAAKRAGVSAERFRRFLYGNKLAKRKSGKWRFTDKRGREMLVLTGGEPEYLVLAGYDQAKLNGEHLAAVKTFVLSGDASLIEPFVGKSVRDLKGKLHPLETDPNELLRIANSGNEVFEEIYNLVIDGE